MSAGAGMAANAKAVMSAVGGMLSVVVAGTALFAYAPASFAGPGTAVLAVIEVLRTANVWLVRNEPALDQAADVAGELIDSMHPPTRAAVPDDRHV